MDEYIERLKVLKFFQFFIPFAAVFILTAFFVGMTVVMAKRYAELKKPYKKAWIAMIAELLVFTVILIALWNIKANPMFISMSFLTGFIVYYLTFFITNIRFFRRLKKNKESKA
ncbi:MAG: hypothetical protein LBT30_01020 [Clostridiales bacterium]|jgi:amino acid transporter|nr:hypothetical protein [Clostridiales bacterium]